MPRQGQIIPEYLVPHVATYINDNSTFTDEAAVAAETGIRSIHVFASAKGEDGVLKAFNNTTDFIKEYGTPNFNLYGQPQYNAYNALASGNARCWCMRVMPKTAKYAHIVILAKAKEVTNTVTGDDNVTTTTKSVEVKFSAVKIDDGVLDKESLPTALGTLASDVADAEGYKTYPILAIVAKGRGKYGNSLRVRIVSDTYSDKDNDFKNYVIEVLDADGGLKKQETFYATIDPNSVIGNNSLFIEDIINDVDGGSKKIEIAVDAEGLTGLYDLYKATLADEKLAVPFSEFDFIGGKTKSGTTIAEYSVATGDVAFDGVSGIPLADGTDSTLDADYVPTTTEESPRETVMDDLYIDAFNGNIDKAILSKRRTPAELIMDAGYSAEVKNAIASLALKRYDARCILDAGIISTSIQAEAWAESMKAYDDRIISKECQHYKIRDPFNGKVIPVTITYFLAGALPTHYTVYGNYVPFVGEDYATLTGYVRNSLKPVIDADDYEIKEALYTNRVNFFECIAEDTFIRGVQGTAQTVWSDLSEENNVAVMLEMKRMLEDFVSKKLYNFAEAEDRVRFTEDADRLFADFRNRKVRSYRVFFDMNAFEEERSILHCYLELVYRTMAKRGIVEIDINKRV